jgi:hypothetical protein
MNDLAAADLSDPIPGPPLTDALNPARPTLAGSLAAARSTAA